MSAPSQTLDTGILVRRSLFFLVLIALTLGNLFTLFRGLNAPQAMDQAQIAREISRGNGFTTKFVRPVAYYQAKTANKAAVSFEKFEDTYHSPLNPLLLAAVFKVIGADDPKAWQMGENEMVFPLDRVVAAVGTLFFLMAIGVNYLLISRVFDAKIAGVCAILMLFCESYWNFALSGLPQMLMLFLFSCGIYFVYRAIEASTEGRIAMAPALLAAVFFTLLSLTHWLTVWIAIGYIIYAAIAFRPRGIVGISILVMILIPAAFVMLRNNSVSGAPFGTAFLTLYNGLASGSEMVVMRTTDLQAEPLQLEGLVSKILRTTLLQATDIVPLLAGIIVAPLFFLALLHPFKRPSIAAFRWAILLMWASAAVGLAFFGITSVGLDPNQIHLVFAPIMMAYGVAFVSILWNRLEFVAFTPALRNLHLFVIVFVCALPLILSLPQKVTLGLNFRDKGGVPHWPPYYAPVLNSDRYGLKALVDPNQVVFADQPWAVAWYADRISVWLPPTRDGFTALETNAADFQTPVAGILITPSSYGSGTVSETLTRYKDFASMVLDGNVSMATVPTLTIFNNDPKLTEITRRYKYRVPLLNLPVCFYTDRPAQSLEKSSR